MNLNCGIPLYMVLNQHKPMALYRDGPLCQSMREVQCSPWGCEGSAEIVKATNRGQNKMCKFVTWGGFEDILTKLI